MVPENAKELFNLRHASLRNVVERIFGVLKRRFEILDTAPEYSLQAQIDLVFAYTALHNVIMEHAVEAAQEDQFEDIYAVAHRESPLFTFDPNHTRPAIGHTSSIKMNQKRDEIAQAMWTQYQTYLAESEE